MASKAEAQAQSQQQQPQDRSPTRSPQRSPRAALVPEATLQAWEQMQVELAKKADFSNARLGFDPSNIIGDFTPAAAKPSSAPAPAPTPAAAVAAGPLGNPAAAIATSGLASNASSASSATALPPLRWIGGLDISFVKDTAIAVASLVVLDVSSLEIKKDQQQQAPGQAATAAGKGKGANLKAGPESMLPVVYEDMLHCTMNVPYVPGFLAFREVDPLRELIKRVRERAPQFMPQVFFVDGNGIHHYRKCGLAVHFGVLEDVPIVGCAKGLLNVDGLSRDVTEKQVVAYAAKPLPRGVVGEDGGFTYRGVNLCPLRGQSGFLYGFGALSGNSQAKPVYVSPGHRIDFRTAALLAIRLAFFRVIEPIRQADLRSRKYINENFKLGSGGGGGGGGGDSD